MVYVTLDKLHLLHSVNSVSVRDTDWLGSNPGLRGQKLPTDRLNYVTACVVTSDVIIQSQFLW